MMQPHRASSGDKILAEHSHQTADAIDALANRIDPAPPISKRPIGLWARLTTYAAGEFDFRQVRRVADGIGGWELSTSGWEDLPGGIASSAVTGMISVGKKCREASGRVGFPYGVTTGMVVWITMSTRNGSPLLDYLFNASLDSFWARNVYGNGSQWEQVHSTGAGTWGTLTGGLTHTNTGKSLREIHGATALPFTADPCRVFLVTPCVDASGILQYTIDLGRSFHCLLSSGSGSQGNATTQCARVYTWTYEDGSALVTSTAPANMRPTVGFVTDGDEAVGRWYNGAFVPGVCNEVADGEACA